MRHNDLHNLQGNKITEVGNVERGDDFGNSIFSYVPHGKYRKAIGLGVNNKAHASIKRILYWCNLLILEEAL